MIVPALRTSRPIGPNKMYPASPVNFFCKFSTPTMSTMWSFTHVVDFWVIQLEVDEKFGSEERKGSKEDDEDDGGNDSWEQMTRISSHYGFTW
jgi:hypothetical protein